MIAPGFDGAFTWILQAEGGYSDDRRDPGGETKFGISKRAYPKLDIATLTLDDARRIYRADFWMPLRCEEMRPEWALALFDAGVLHGNAQAVRLLQLGLGVPMDGIIGPETLDAVKRANLEAHLTAFLSWRVYHVATTPIFNTYIRGWSRRFFRLALECQRLAGHQ